MTINNHNNHKKLAMAGVLIATSLLVGCEGMGRKQTTGTAIGGVTGAVVGAEVSHSAVGAGVGAAAGGLIGSEVGKSMEENK